MSLSTRNKTINVFATVLLLLISFGVGLADPKYDVYHPKPTVLNPIQKKMVNKVINDLELTEQVYSEDPELFGDRVTVMEDMDFPRIAKLPPGDLKKCLFLAIHTQMDLVTFSTETQTYPYYDLIANRQTPKILKKYNIQIDLSKGGLYGRLDTNKLDAIKTLLNQVAVGLRQRAQGDIR